MSLHREPLFLLVLVIFTAKLERVASHEPYTFGAPEPYTFVAPELYWKSALPNTPIPKVVMDLLKPEVPGQPDVATVRVSENTATKPRPRQSPFVYNYIANETQLNDDARVTPFFLEEDLRTGKTVSLDFTESEPTATFLPRQEADSKHFSSFKFAEIFRDFSVKPESDEARAIKRTIKECETRGIRGEEKYCATSLESMVDFVVAKLGRNVRALTTEAQKQSHKQDYVIEDGVTKMAAQKFVVCHRQEYPYAVFYCHTTENSAPFVMRLKAADGTKTKALAICHADTSAWNPKHMAFRLLKVEPGTVPVCHFTPQSHIVWVKN